MAVFNEVSNDKSSCGHFGPAEQFTVQGERNANLADAIASRTVRFCKGLKALQSCLRIPYLADRWLGIVLILGGMKALCGIEICFAPATLPAVTVARSPSSMGYRTSYSGKHAKNERRAGFRFEQGQIGLRHCFTLNLSRFALQPAELLGDYQIGQSTLHYLARKSVNGIYKKRW